jgi:hypothetical protein
MAQVNPYAAPKQADASTQPTSLPPGLSLSKAFLIVGATGGVMAIGGACIGALLGAVAPDYYRTVFSSASPGFNPLHVGFGLGLSQGLIVGLIVGAVVVLAVAISSRRTKTA